MEKAPEYKKVVSHICGKIADGSLEMGSRLPTERQLAEDLSLSRNCVREGLRVLKDMGVLEGRQGSGNYLAENFAARISSLLKFLILMRRVDTAKINEFRRMMEESACLRILERGLTEEEKAEAQKIVAGKAFSDLEEEIRSDRNFHAFIIRAAANPIFSCIMEAASDLYKDWITDVLEKASSQKRSALRLAHQEIVMALASGDAKSCRAAICRHYGLAQEICGGGPR